jgi:hypothetical protein
MQPTHLRALGRVAIIVVFVVATAVANPPSPASAARATNVAADITSTQPVNPQFAG